MDQNKLNLQKHREEHKESVAVLFIPHGSFLRFEAEAAAGARMYLSLQSPNSSHTLEKEETSCGNVDRMVTSPPHEWKFHLRNSRAEV